MQTTRKQDSATPSRVRITVRGKLSPRLAFAFDGLSAHHHSGRTDLEGEITDQAQLHGLLSRVRDLGLELENVTISRPSERAGRLTPRYRKEAMSQLNDSQHRTRLRLLATRKAGHSALIVTVCILVWAITTSASGYFWPGWVMLVAALSFLAQVGKAALGDAKQRQKLEQRYGGPR